MQSRDELVVKEVDFMGDILMAAKDRDGNIWAGVSYFCRGLGMNKKEKDRQVSNVQTDEVLKRGSCKFGAGVFDQDNMTVALKLEFVPLWLAKISITPSMKESKPELVDKLVEYQLKAKDVLAEAFLPTYGNAEKSYETKATSLGEIASFNKEMDRCMEKQGSAPWKICEAFKMVSEQFGIIFPTDFVKVPAYEQMELAWTKEKE